MLFFVFNDILASVVLFYIYFQFPDSPRAGTFPPSLAVRD